MSQLFLLQDTRLQIFTPRNLAIKNRNVSYRRNKSSKSIKLGIISTKNLGSAANYVRAACFSKVKGQIDAFSSLEAALSYIAIKGDIDYVYDVRCQEDIDCSQLWVYDSSRNWHKTSFRQDVARGYKSDKNICLRIH